MTSDPITCHCCAQAVAQPFASADAEFIGRLVMETLAAEGRRP